MQQVVLSFFIFDLREPRRASLYGKDLMSDFVAIKGADQQNDFVFMRLVYYI